MAILEDLKAGAFWSDDYEMFLVRRQDRLWQDIKRVTGATGATDLESNDAEPA